MEDRRLTIQAFGPKTMHREWGTETIVAETPHYLGKVLRMEQGGKGGLQKHVEKVETFHLFAGLVIVRSDDGTGQLQEVVMWPGESYHIPAGAAHQVEALEDSVLFEASTAHYDDRIRVEKDYGLPEGGGLPTTR